MHLPEEQKVYKVHLFTTQKATNPCTQKRFSCEKSVKNGKDLTVKSRHGNNKKVILSWTTYIKNQKEI